MLGYREKLQRFRAEVRTIYTSVPEIRSDSASLAAQISQLETSLSAQISQLEAIAEAVDRKASEIGISVGELLPTKVDETWVPPGHFYSPICDPSEIERRSKEIFRTDEAPIGIELRIEEQLDLLDRLSIHCRLLNFPEEKTDGCRFFHNNTAFGHGDASVLACMLMEFKPKRFVEIGSGYSSSLVIEVNNKFLGDQCSLTFIEPYPDLLHSLMTDEDRNKHRIQPVPVQDMDLAVIDELEAGDFLFIDSTHVTKAGSDVNFELFTILPRLKPGVHIHFHDIFYPFEYPKAWLLGENRSWNECYILRAFLTDNRNYEISFFSDYLAKKHQSKTVSALPPIARNSGGSLWLRKVG